ncbi:hypothetical protein [Xanthomonas hydrangeae]|uniref:hypothetical protein n=1 Tax=Xanthomonas hydrangeae TaxID=2775159 RepID=UPI0019650053
MFSGMFVLPSAAAQAAALWRVACGCRRTTGAKNESHLQHWPHLQPAIIAASKRFLHRLGERGMQSSITHLGAQRACGVRRSANDCNASALLPSHATQGKRA